MEILNIIFIISGAIILITTPFIIISILLYFLSTKLKLTFKITGFYELSNILFAYENNLIKLELKIEKIELILIWLRLRVRICGVQSFIEMNNSHLLKKIKSMNLKSKKIDDSLSSEIKIDVNLKEKFFLILRELIEKDSQIKKNKNKQIRKMKDSNGNFSGIENLIQDKRVNYFYFLFKFILTLIDIEIRHVNVVFKLKENDGMYGINLAKTILGVVKCSDKVNKIF